MALIGKKVRGPTRATNAPRRRFGRLDTIGKRGREARDREVLPVVSYKAFQGVLSSGMQIRDQLVQTFATSPGLLRHLPRKHADGVKEVKSATPNEVQRLHGHACSDCRKFPHLVKVSLSEKLNIAFLVFRLS